MKSKTSSKLSFVLYEDKSPPRYYNISKRNLRFMLFGLPTVTLMAIIIVAAGGVYFKHIQRLAERKEPAIIKKLKEEKDELLKARDEITLSRDRLQEKLSAGISNDSGLGFLSLFRQSPGRQDLSSSPEMQLEEIELSPLEDKVSLSFKIVNMTKDDSRLTGYLFVVAKTGDNIQVWPTTALEEDSMQIPFGGGEFFATSRFRPVRADFRRLPNVNKTLFKVVIFSRTGDLIFKQLISKNI